MIESKGQETVTQQLTAVMLHFEAVLSNDLFYIVVDLHVKKAVF